MMARHLRSILGEKLLTKPVADLNPATLPSPEVSSSWSILRIRRTQLTLTCDVGYVLQDLKYKILVKGQKEHQAERCSSDCSSSDEEAGCSEGKPSLKKEERKVSSSALPGRWSSAPFSCWLT